MNTFKNYLQTIGEYGVITKIMYPLVVVEGLPGAKLHEFVLFENGVQGEIFSIAQDSIVVLSFSKDSLKAGMQVVRTNTELSIAVGNDMLGSAIDPLGNPLSSLYKKSASTTTRVLDVAPSGIASRSRIKKAMETGVSIVDILIPIGKGQRELVIGDRKTGKTLFLLDALSSQVQQGAIVIYAAIGKKKSDIKQLESYFQEKKLFNSLVLVATSSYDAPSLIYLTPYAAMAIAEYFRDQGKDTVVILDDLSTHAKFYREISLQAKNFPGRDSYPGDIFHAHAKLLERSGNFIVNGKDVAITCLPVVETIEGDFTGYIATNIMSMTDGHIYFDTNVLYQGRRPAINSTLSVTRVGKQIHTPLQRNINRELLALLTLYEKMQNLSHFGAELSEDMKNVLESGEKFYNFFNQPPDTLLSPEVQIVLLALLWTGSMTKEDMEKKRTKFLLNAKTPEAKKLLQATIQAASFNDLLRNVQNQKVALEKLCE